MDEHHTWSLLQLSDMIRNKKVSPVEVTRNLLQKIERENETTNTFITVMKDKALQQAEEAEKEIERGTYKGPLHGIPLAVKDNIAVQGVRCTNGSAVDEQHISQQNAAIIDHLEEEGAILIGKTNLDEYANHVTGKNKQYGTIQHPLNPAHSVGGSSGGSAAAVASHMAYGAIGTDTSGSVRIPAACCGIVGLKPTYDLLPVSGVTPLSWSLDHVGILSKDCQDLSVLFHTIVPGAHQTTARLPKPVDMKQVTIGIPDNYFFEKMEDTVKGKVKEVIDLCVQHGATYKEVTIPHVEEMMDVQETVIGAEAAYFHKKTVAEHKDRYEKENYMYFTYGQTITPEEYKAALTWRERIKRASRDVFEEVDILLTPTLPITAPKLTANAVRWGEEVEDMLLTLSRFTGPFNVSGLPALSVPIGHNEEQLPIGLQLVGDLYQEEKLIDVGHWIMEQVW
ncbi:amidase [Alteribacillus iranensis]|uniref:Aspartyl-tRNA(Asn)/glutamyl-tRNA(Gln) amidotransferase subunit A n=1 Tax=Alteribacillus iranensis TaxID=930128 RepID=A0A1I2BWL2_9BACI|nr:amidase [Alteribacillus iranensis]SFE60481.1 aspartyl-tRNA(Asn)/glutamyl-tRNA(Gln) amidotransferase subunit A [Alteribacillus iranensis]